MLISAQNIFFVKKNKKLIVDNNGCSAAPIKIPFSERYRVVTTIYGNRLPGVALYLVGSGGREFSHCENYAFENDATCNWGVHQVVLLQFFVDQLH